MGVLYLPDELRERIDRVHERLYDDRPGTVPVYRVVEEGLQAIDDEGREARTDARDVVPDRDRE